MHYILFAYSTILQSVYYKKQSVAMSRLSCLRYKWDEDTSTVPFKYQTLQLLLIFYALWAYQFLAVKMNQPRLVTEAQSISSKLV